MINYWPLKFLKSSVQRRQTVAGLQRLRGLIRDKMPERDLRSTLLLGTWNIRNFDDNRFGDGPRRTESLFYIAEVISAFDIVAIQEITRDLSRLRQVMTLLGPNYDLIATDITEGPSGNEERLAFIYDRNTVWFRDIAGEIVLPFKRQISDVTKRRQFARTPFTCAFQSGWFKFVLSTVHVYYGKQSKKSNEYKRRVKEIEGVAKFLKKRADKEKDNYILVGDFNIDKPGDPTFNALKDQGFSLFQNKTGSNRKKTKHYDQISWLPSEPGLRQTVGERKQGVLDLFSVVFKEDEFGRYKKAVTATLNRKLTAAKTALKTAKEKSSAKKIKSAEKRVANFDAILADQEQVKKYYVNTWRTFQISDHLPLWVQLDTDFSAPYLDSLAEGTFTIEDDGRDDSLAISLRSGAQ
jgi:endonuclease/exonuclease/phosphatase family metal-dependent hydrolase